MGVQQSEIKMARKAYRVSICAMVASIFAIFIPIGFQTLESDRLTRYLAYKNYRDAVNSQKLELEGVTWLIKQEKDKRPEEYRAMWDVLRPTYPPAKIALPAGYEVFPEAYKDCFEEVDRLREELWNYTLCSIGAQDKTHLRCDNLPELGNEDASTRQFDGGFKMLSDKLEKGLVHLQDVVHPSIKDDLLPPVHVGSASCAKSG